ncbi:MAG: hypothetical protein MUQ20_02820, partial [Deltaproteobacteria bacterium]|nr:hypothetical protein [Deltaproteobacteria bacterium]
MSGNLKPPWPEKNSLNPQLLEKAENYLNRLLAAKESDAFTLEIINDLVRELDDNPALAELFLKKITSHKGSFSPWFLLDLNRRTQSKSVQKGIKRTLYLLKQKGIELPPSADTPPQKEGGILKNI